MTLNEYLDAAKIALGVSSDYELAKRLEVSKQAMSSYRHGERSPDTYMIFKVAITLNLDPATVLADLESQREKSGKRLDFWKGFLSRAAIVGAIVCTLALSFSGMQGSGHATHGGFFRRPKSA